MVAQAEIDDLFLDFPLPLLVFDQESTAVVVRAWGLEPLKAGI